MNRERCQSREDKHLLVAIKRENSCRSVILENRVMWQWEIGISLLMKESSSWSRKVKWKVSTKPQMKMSINQLEIYRNVQNLPMYINPTMFTKREREEWTPTLAKSSSVQQISLQTPPSREKCSQHQEFCSIKQNGSKIPSKEGSNLNFSTSKN